VSTVRELTEASDGAVQSVIADRHPGDGRTWDCQCARCGSSAVTESCELCFGDGFHCDDDSDEKFDCCDCNGAGAFVECLSSVDWCNAHPIAGREETKRGAIEWFTFDKPREGGAS
jgi:hypothetical protein